MPEKQPADKTSAILRLISEGVTARQAIVAQAQERWGLSISPALVSQVKARAMADAAGIRLGSVVSITDLRLGRAEIVGLAGVDGNGAGAADQFGLVSWVAVESHCSGLRAAGDGSVGPPACAFGGSPSELS